MENPNENKITKIIFNQVSLFVACVGLVSSVMFWVMNPQQSLELSIVKLQGQVETNEQVGVMLQKFKDNDLHELQLRMEQIEARQIEEMKGMSRIETLLSQHIK